MWNWNCINSECENDKFCVSDMFLVVLFVSGGAATAAVVFVYRLIVAFNCEL